MSVTHGPVHHCISFSHILSLLGDIEHTVNLFLGPNNSGKSAILSAINLLSQTLDSADRDVPLLLNGKFESENSTPRGVANTFALV